MLTKRAQLITVGVLAALISGIALFGALDRPSERFLEQSLERSLVAFATARALNGVISVAQGTEVALEPAGVGVNFSPGEILDPVNDLIERFSWVMLAASGSLGVQKLLLEISAWWPVTALLCGGVALAVWGFWRGTWQNLWFKRVLGRLLLLSLVLRFAVPLLSLTGEIIYLQFLAPQYEQASGQLEATRAEVDLLNHSLSSPAQEESGLLDTIGNIATELGEWRSNLSKYQAAAESATQSTLNLIVIFVFQTAVMPLIFMWWLVAWLRAWFRRID